MPFFDLVDRDGRVIQQILAESRLEAQSSMAASLDRRIVAAVPAGVSARNDAPDLVAIAEARLAEAFSRLGLTDRQAEQAVLGRDASPLERARVDRLREGLVAGQAFRGDAPQKKGINVDGRQIKGMEPGDSPAPTRSSPNRPTSRTPDSWDMVTPILRREAQAQTAETAGALIRAGYDPNDVARALGLPLRHTGAPPVTVQAAEPPASVTPAPESTTPVAASEAARRADRGEDVELREVTSTEDRIGDAIGRAFCLSEAERGHASRGR